MSLALKALPQRSTAKKCLRFRLLVPVHVGVHKDYNYVVEDDDNDMYLS